MPKIAYITKRFRKGSLQTIAAANEIIADFKAQGYDLTLRQLYYQFVSKDMIPNTARSYDNLGATINDARLAGLVDWNSIEDRTRELITDSHWDDPADVIDSAAEGFALDKWRGQDRAPEVWIEKDALIGVIDGVCRELDVPRFSCRGYVSQSEMWRAGMRMRGYLQNDKTPIIFHLGDHDPSGMDMTRDIRERLTMFAGAIEVNRIALNMDQIKKYDPPPNPAKFTDSRAEEYVAEFGDESWELDALPPAAMTALVREHVESVVDQDLWDEVEAEQERGRELLREVSRRWDEVEHYIEDNPDGGDDDDGD